MVKGYVLGTYISMLPTSIKKLVEIEVVEIIESMELSDIETKQSIDDAMSGKLIELEDLIDLDYILEKIS